MGTGMKIGIATLSMILVGALIVIVTQLAGNDDEANPSPTPSVSDSPSQESPSAEPSSEEPSTEETPESPTEEPSPEPTESTEETPSEEETPSDEATDGGDGSEPDQTFMGPGKAEFENFTVEVLPLTDEEANQGAEEGVNGSKIKVCVLNQVGDAEEGLTRLSLEPWTMVSSTGEVQKPITDHPYEPAFPEEDLYAIGECVEGWIAFNNFEDDQIDYSELVYKNGLGDHATWNFH